jgi:hypothetical protein
MLKIKFIWMLMTSALTPTGENDGYKIYTVITPTETIEYAYKSEVINYLETGTFEYNDFLNK